MYTPRIQVMLTSVPEGSVLKCKICLMKAADIKFIYCNHKVFCEDCYSKRQLAFPCCPCCGKVIQEAQAHSGRRYSNRGFEFRC